MSEQQPEEERKVVSLNGAPIAVLGQPQPDVVKMLAELLARAEQGEIRDLAIAYVGLNGETAWNFVAPENKYGLSHALMMLGMQYSHACYEQTEEVAK